MVYPRDDSCNEVFLVLIDFNSSFYDDYRSLSKFMNQPKKSKLLAVKRGDILFLNNISPIKWWLKVKKKNRSSEGQIVEIEGVVPSTILVPIKKVDEIEFQIKIDEIDRSTLMPTFCKNAKRFFPLIFEFYGCVEQEPCRIVKSSLFNKVFYTWITYYLTLGYHRYFMECDLWKPSPTERCSFITEKILMNNSNLSYLFWGFVKEKRSWFLTAALFKFGHDIGKLAIPYLISSMIDYAASEDADIQSGITITFGLFLWSCLNTILFTKYFEYTYNLGGEIRCLLTYAIYRKMFTTHCDEFSNYSLSYQISLINTDSYRVQEAISKCIMMLSLPFQMVICTAALIYVMGYSSIGVIGILILIFPLNLVLGGTSRWIDSKLSLLKDKRIKLINSILSGIKLMKLYCWEDAFNKIIKNIRKKEVIRLVQLRFLLSLMFSIMNMIPIFMAMVAYFMFYKRFGYLDAKIAFVTLSIFSLIRIPVMFVPEVISVVVNGINSYKRIESYLRSKDSLETQGINFRQINVCVPAHIEISFKEVNLSFTSNEEACLKNINLRFLSTEFHIIIGSTGSGKTTLLQSILNMSNIKSGEIDVRGKVGYLPQSPWIINASFRSNIISDLDFDEEKYKKILNVCELIEDIRSLPQSDFTEIGEKGVNLSGGQKQRVALARCLYYGADIYVFDDPFSALDTTVSDKIFFNLYGKDGYLSNNLKLLTTYNLKFLKFADYLHVLQNRTIIFSGTFDEFDFLPQDIKQYIFSIQKCYDNDPAISQSERHIDNASFETAPRPTIKDEKLHFTEKETIDKGLVTLRVFKEHLNSIGIVLFIALILTNMIFTGLNVAGQLITSYFTDERLEGERFTSFIQLFLIVSFSQSVSCFLINTSLALSVFVSANYFHSVLIKFILKSPLAYLETIQIGRLLNLFSSDMRVVDEQVTNTLCTNIYLISILTLSSIGISIRLPYMIFGIFFLTILLNFFKILYLKTSRQIQRIEFMSRSPIISYLVQTYNGLSIVKSNNQQSIFINNFENLLDKNLIAYKMNNFCNRWITIRLEFLGNFLVLLACAIIVVLASTIRVNQGSVGFVLYTITTITNIMSFAIRQYCDYENQLIAIERISKFFVIPSEDDPDCKENLPIDWPKDGLVEFKEYSCSYRSHLPNVLESLSFTIEPGLKVGVVGRTGSGKSSLLLSLFRMMKVNSGSISIDKVDISKIDFKTLRNHLTIIPQDSFLFNGSLRENLDPLSQYTPESIKDALFIAQLEKFYLSHFEGLEYPIFDDGRNISSGEKQLICLARAILKKNKILILDEATSNVDTHTDKIIQAVIRNQFADCTIITVAHRIETIIDYDKIIVLDHGRLIEFDTPSNLLSNPESLFYKLHHRIVVFD